MNPFQKYKNDAHLIAALGRKENGAFDYLYRHYGEGLKSFVRKIGGKEEDANEIEQNVIIHLYEKIVAGEFKLNDNTKLSTYMNAVGKNMWYKKCKKKLTSDNTVIDQIGYDDNDINDFYDVDDTERMVTGALVSIDSDCKDILVKFYYDKKSMKEIATEMPLITEDNLRKRKYKCLKKLEKYLITKIKYDG